MAHMNFCAKIEQLLKYFMLLYSQELDHSASLDFTYYFEGFGLSNKEEYKHIVAPLSAVTFPAKTSRVTVTLRASHVGRVAIGLNSSNQDLERYVY